MSETAAQETLNFETEIQELLQLITHSLYSHKEIFIRELVSNASDAIDKLRFNSITDSALLGDDSEFKITLKIDKDKKQFIISDNGIGMSRDDLKKNLGTIARSGSKEFLKAVKNAKDGDISLIGQFGVGFYSIFMVADKAEVISKKAGETESWRWISDGKGAYTIESSDKSERGTEIILHMNDEGEEYLEDWQVRTVIRKFSDFVAHDILMPEIDTRSQEDKEKDLKDGKIFSPKLEVINSGKALWARPKAEITDEMYDDFYKHISHDYEAPLARTHFNQEGMVNFTSLLFIPGKAPFDLFTNPEPKGLSLYVKKVFIMDDCKELLPQYLRFIKGVVDTEDLPLNISREILQQNKMAATIKKTLVRKSIALLKEIADKEPEKYMTFWNEMGAVLKEGVHHDFENKEKLASLLRYNTLNSSDEKISLDSYIQNSGDDQKTIYYITAESNKAALASPHLEIFRKKNIDVLFMTDPVDEWVASSLMEYSGRKLESVVKGELDLDSTTDEEKKKIDEAKEELKGVIGIFKDNLKDKIKDVRISSRLTDSPCCLVSEQGEMSANMERILKMSKQGEFNSKKILEVNPDHPVIRKMESIKDSETVKDWVFLLYDQSLLAEGSQVEDPAIFNQRLNKFILQSV